MKETCMPTKSSAGCSLDPTLDDEELKTIEIIARNGQSGRITKFEVKELVAAYRELTSLRSQRDALVEALTLIEEEAHEQATSIHVLYFANRIREALAKAKAQEVTT